MSNTCEICQGEGSASEDFDGRILCESCEGELHDEADDERAELNSLRYQ